MNQELLSIKLDCVFTESEEHRYIAWLYSPSVFTDTPNETMLAYKISKLLKINPTSTLRILRGMPDQNPDWVATIEAFVIGNSSISFIGEPPKRLIVLTDG